MRNVGVLKVLPIVMALAAAPPLFAQEADYPTEPVSVVVAYPAGGPNDLVARAISQQLGETWDQPVVVENRPGGAGGAVGTQFVADAEPDGHTLGLTSITLSILPGLHPDLPFDPVEDFTAISLVGRAPLLVVVHPSVEANSLEELIALAESKPGELTYASTGNGTSIHLSAEMFKRQAGLDIIHVPFRGSAPAMTALLGGEVDMMIEAMPSALPHVKSGGLRALAITTAERSPELPDLPTLSEAGLPGLEVMIWWGMVGPAGLPGGVTETVATAVNEALQTQSVGETFANLGIQPVGTSPEEFAEVIRKDVERFGEVVREADIQVDD